MYKSKKLKYAFCLLAWINEVLQQMQLQKWLNFMLCECAPRHTNLHSKWISPVVIIGAAETANFVECALRGGTHTNTHLDGGTAVEAKGLCLPVLQVDLQDIWHEQKRVVLHRVLQKETRDRFTFVILFVCGHFNRRWMSCKTWVELKKCNTFLLSVWHSLTCLSYLVGGNHLALLI